jgi:hypothetical protein
MIPRPVAVGLVAACGAAHPLAPMVSVGTATLTVTDPARRGPVDASRPRTWIVQVYYPSEPTPVVDVYAGDPALVDALVASHYYDAGEAELRGWASRPAFAATGAKPAASGSLVTLSPGLGFARLNYAELASHLVARGHIVAVIDHPYIGVSRVGGRVVSANDDPVLASSNPADSLPRIRDWTRDISVTLDDLAKQPVAGLAIDVANVTAAGHSIGGTAAAGAGVDPRVRACIDFEGFLAGIDALATGSACPVLAGFSRAKGRPPVLKPGEPDPMDAVIAALAARGRPIWTVKITGGSHTSFSDAPDVLPRTLSRFGGELMPAARSFEVYAGLVDAFARAYAPSGGGDAAFQAFLATVPEAAGIRH